MWPMAVLLGLSELQTLAGAFMIWATPWDPEMGGWFASRGIYTVMPAILVMLLWAAKSTTLRSNASAFGSNSYPFEPNVETNGSNL